MAKGSAPVLEHSGRLFSEAELEQIRETVELLPKLSIKELGSTIAEHLDRYSTGGTGRPEGGPMARSRREADREMRRPVFRENLMALFPDLESIPHHDTLMRLLDRIDVEEIQQAQLQLLRTLIGKRKFQRYLVQGCYP
ncbi:MAG: hypothetical protein DRP87_00855, partial [Spirochaetes bacterium]